jgi:hypothetical protein
MFRAARNELTSTMYKADSCQIPGQRQNTAVDVHRIMFWKNGTKRIVSGQMLT